jgi:hypothetical protein
MDDAIGVANYSAAIGCRHFRKLLCLAAAKKSNSARLDWRVSATGRDAGHSSLCGISTDLLLAVSHDHF